MSDETPIQDSRQKCLAEIREAVNRHGERMAEHGRGLDQFEKAGLAVWHLADTVEHLVTSNTLDWWRELQSVSANNARAMQVVHAEYEKALKELKNDNSTG